MRAIFGYPISCSVLTSSFCIIFVSVLSKFLCTDTSRDCIESLRCFFVIAKCCPLSLIILGYLLRRSNGKKSGEDWLLGHTTGRDTFEPFLMIFSVAFIICGQGAASLSWAAGSKIAPKSCTVSFRGFGILLRTNDNLVSSGRRSRITHHTSPRCCFLHVRPSRHKHPRLLQLCTLQ